MKRKPLLLIPTCLLGILLGCKTDKDILPDWFAQGWGQASAVANGSEWTNIGSTALLTKGQLSKQPELTIQIYKFSKGGFLRGSVQFAVIPQQVDGRYRLRNDTTRNCGNDCVLATYSTYQDDGDVSGSVYTLDVSQANYLQVTAYDSTNKRIAGAFQATFIKDAYYQKTDDPAIIRFEHGTFNTPIANKGRFE